MSNFVVHGIPGSALRARRARDSDREERGLPPGRARLLGGNTYLAGAQVSLADMMVAAHMNFLAERPEWAPLTAERSNLPAWLARVNARKSFEATTRERVAEMGKAA